MNIWAVGADGAIGSACVAALDQRHDVVIRKTDVRNGHEIATALGSHKPDALVYAAGTNYLEWSDRVQWDRMLDVYDVNVVGLVRCLMIATTVKKCVVIGSDAATRPMRTSIAYNASKAALNAAVKCIARERAKELQINVVSPGLVAPSGMTDYVYLRTSDLRSELDLAKYMLSPVPAGRVGSPFEVAEVVRWLLEDAPEYLNGSIIEVNGAR